jgi:cupin-like protein
MSAAEPLLELRPGGAGRNLGRAPFVIRHNLVDHPLLTLPRLVDLAGALPAHDVEYNAGDLPIGQDPNLTPRNGLSPAETVRRIASCRSWLALKHVEQVPELGALVDRCLDEVAAAQPAATRGMRARHGFVFVSSPGAVTPYHIDPELNFLLQISGTKTLHLWDGEDRSVVSEAELEQFLGGGHRNLVFRPELAARARTFQLAPGEALHVPVTWPHWVKNGPTVSISFSVTFRTDASEERETIFKVNRVLRRIGVAPLAVGRSPVRDQLKLRAFALARQGRRLLHSAAGSGERHP